MNIVTIVTNESFEGIDRAFGMNMISIRKYVEELHDVVSALPIRGYQYPTEESNFSKAAES